MIHKLKKIKSTNGLAALPSILVISFIALITGLAIVSGGFIETAISQSEKLSLESFYLAEAGIKDALIKITRNKNFNNSGYDLFLGNGSATIVIEKDQPIAGQTRVTSTGTVKNRIRKIQMIVNVTSNGKVTTASWQEIAD